MAHKNWKRIFLTYTLVVSLILTLSSIGASAYDGSSRPVSSYEVPQANEFALDILEEKVPLSAVPSADAASTFAGALFGTSLFGLVGLVCNTARKREDE